MITVGIIGGAGYTAGELLRILVRHPEVMLDFVFSTSQTGEPVAGIHQDLLGETELVFTGSVNPEVDVVFLCLGHGNSEKFLKENEFSDSTRIIDLSTDFRDFEGEHQFIYGIPETRKKEIKNARYIANPGCFASAINLALLPLASKGLLQDEVHVNGVTGATGAGTSLSDTTHFSWRDNNFSAYKAFEHQHLKEVTQNIRSFQPDFNSAINFIPNRGNFSRGIHVTCYTRYSGDLEEAKELYQDFYADAPFTFMVEEEVHLKQVVNTNKCLLRLQKFGDKLLVTSVLDNLLKGASGQAVQKPDTMPCA